MSSDYLSGLLSIFAYSHDHKCCIGDCYGYCNCLNGVLWMCQMVVTDKGAVTASHSTKAYTKFIHFFY